MRFEPSGFTKNPDIRNAASITDYVFRWLALQFVPGYREANAPSRNQPELAMPGLQEEVKKKINRPVPELPLADDTDILTWQSDADGNGKGHGNGHAQAPRRPPVRCKSLSDSVAHFQRTPPPAPTAATSPSATAPATSASTAARAWVVLSRKLPNLGR